MAFEAAAADVRAGLAGPVPAHLRDAHYAGAERLGHGQGYSYPHDDPAGVVAQQYAPDSIAGRTYYHPTRHGTEARYAERSERIREILGRTSNASLTPSPAPAAGPAPGQPTSADPESAGPEPGDVASGETGLTGARSLGDAPAPGEAGGTASAPAGAGDGLRGAQS
jgi:putative ATPase